jgi:hypothetical protein
MIETELEKILGSKWLRESSQLSALLSYVVEETLAGRGAGLKEYSLGLEVFHRPRDYDPRNDAIVRVQASLLRKRLAAYYENEGKDAPVLIEIPRGGYVAEFQLRSREEAIVAQEPPRPVPKWWVPFAVGLAMGAAMVAAGSLWASRPSPVAGKAIWSSILDSKVEAIASFGVPLFYTGNSGLYFRDVQVNSPEQEPGGKIPWISEKLKMSFRPQEDVYTGVGDAIGTHLIARWLETHGVKVAVANSNFIGPSDIEGKNLIVVASARFQTLLQRLKLENRYHFDVRGISGGYRVDLPLPGEQEFYQPTAGIGVLLDYAVISVWPGKQAGTRILYISGVNTWSTEGAARYALDDQQMAELERKLAVDPVEGPLGRKGPYFQVLLQVEGKANRVRSARYVSHRYLKGND